MSSNPESARCIVALMALYLHLGPFSRYVIGQIEQKIEDLEPIAFDALAGDASIKSTSLQSAR